jgi:hypothetical protein
MEKIPTVFLRNPDNMATVLEEWNPECLWVRDGEGVATRKYDGTCVMFDGTRWWARREIKPGKAEPPNYQRISIDPNTGKTMGWEPAEQSSFYQWLLQALVNNPNPDWITGGTYELIGPKINGNPEGSDEHTLISHEFAEHVDPANDGHMPELQRTYLWIRAHALTLKERGVEGIVYHHPDGRMAKIKGKDFPS